MIHSNERPIDFCVQIYRDPIIDQIDIQVRFKVCDLLRLVVDPDNYVTPEGIVKSSNILDELAAVSRIVRILLTCGWIERYGLLEIPERVLVFYRREVR